jgi:hypothetical protein
VAVFEVHRHHLDDGEAGWDGFRGWRRRWSWRTGVVCLNLNRRGRGWNDAAVGNELSDEPLVSVLGFW